MTPTIEQVKEALRLPDFDGLAAHKKMMPAPRPLVRPFELSGSPRIGAVLLLLYCHQDELSIVLTRRRDDLQSHPGQISFPGGRHEAPETLVMTALRETHEEIGVEPDVLTVLGELTPIYILPSDFEVHPFVAWYKNGERPFFHPDPREVAEIVEAPLRLLLDPAIRAEEVWNIRGLEVAVPYFAVGSHKVWGATAMMLSEFLERLRLVGKTGNG